MNEIILTSCDHGGDDIGDDGDVGDVGDDLLFCSNRNSVFYVHFPFK